MRRVWVAVSFALIVVWGVGGGSALAQCASPPGDIDGDGVANVLDVQCGVLAVLVDLVDLPSSASDCAAGPGAADLSCSGGLSIVDVQLVVAIVIGAELGALDANGDGCPDACDPPPVDPCASCGCGESCISDECVFTACDGQECGSDGCGGDCGQCGAGLSCSADICASNSSVQSLFDERVGFGRFATGGLGGTDCVVTSLADSGGGTLRSCAQTPGPVWITFAVDGDITLGSTLDLHSDTTIDGRGRYIRLFGGQIRISDESNVIVVNLIFKSSEGGGNDALQIIDAASDIWVHHVSFSDYGDGLLDITKAATDITVSWCKFSIHDKTMLIGASVDHTGDSVIRVTLHHNWFRETHQRHPRIRYGKLHAFNNFYDEWGSYGVACSQKAECYLEGNVYQAGDDDDAVISQVGADPSHGKVKSVSEWKVNGATVEENDTGSVFDPDDYYPSNAQTANSSLRDTVEENAGWQ